MYDLLNFVCNDGVLDSFFFAKIFIILVVCECFSCICRNAVRSAVK